MAEQGQNDQKKATVRVFLNEAEKAIDVMPTHASSEDGTVDQGFSSDKEVDSKQE